MFFRMGERRKELEKLPEFSTDSTKFQPRHERKGAGCRSPVVL
jgi:hypothetical protein